MYLPPDLTRYTRQTPQQFMQMLNGSILPIQVTDPNCMFRLNEEEFQFDLLDATFKPDIAIRISRTPLMAADPRTYASMSKFVEHNLRRYHSTLANANQNQLTRPLSLPPEMVGVQADGKTEVLPLGCSINPLSSDPFKNVHLTPGCLCSIVDYKVVRQWQARLSKPGAQRTAALSTGGFEPEHSSKNRGVASSSTSDPTCASHPLTIPKNNLPRNNSPFIARVFTGDNFNKKFAAAEKLLVGCHGRAVNVIILDDDPKHIEVDPPILRLYIHDGVITCTDTYPYITPTGEKNFDVLIGLASGDLMWLNPMKQKFSIWNKNGCLKKSPVTSVEWSKCGTFATAGFADGDVMVFSRDLEDDEEYGETPKEPVYKDRYMRTYRSLRSNGSGGNAHVSNPIAHYKFSKKSIVDMTTHPYYHNIVAMACDDGYLRIFDLLKERLTDLQESYYAGFLTVSFTEDGKYLLAGGEDDLVSIYEFQGVSLLAPSNSGLIKLVARLQGSESWVRDITVDRHRSKTGILYRIGTVGDDGALRFYEFQPRSLPKIKKVVNKRVAASRTDGKPVSSRKPQSSAKATAMRRVLNSKHGKNNESVSSISSNPNRRLSLMEIMSQGSNTSLQQLQFQQQQQQETSFDDQYIKGNYIFSNHRLPCLKTDSGSSGSHLHTAAGLKNCPVLYPICEKEVKLGRMSGVYFEKDYVWAFVCTGDMIRWKRP
ncbi:DEKNAAC102244 [Brettanomyces naardenensis]|uniref:DEKNAAC102244 n=1 Tax=Brettanomyces naardenensis TaxID=13370 RepID=A0A448YKN8_BRENA|nr:DEKNAAC102244 [Brettanomyces naardenensis]